MTNASKTYTPKETARLVKKELTERFYGVKFSVTSDRSSYIYIVNVSWVDGPSQSMVQGILEKYRGEETTIDDSTRKVKSPDGNDYGISWCSCSQSLSDETRAGAIAFLSENWELFKNIHSSDHGMYARRFLISESFEEFRQNNDKEAQPVPAPEPKAPYEFPIVDAVPDLYDFDAETTMMDISAGEIRQALHEYGLFSPEYAQILGDYLELRGNIYRMTLKELCDKLGSIQGLDQFALIEIMMGYGFVKVSHCQPAEELVKAVKTLKSGQKVTFARVTGMAFLSYSNVTIKSVSIVEYAQYKNTLRITFAPKGKRKEKAILIKSDSNAMILDGWRAEELQETIKDPEWKSEHNIDGRMIGSTMRRLDSINMESFPIVAAKYKDEALFLFGYTEETKEPETVQEFEAAAEAGQPISLLGLSQAIKKEQPQQEPEETPSYQVIEEAPALEPVTIEAPHASYVIVEQPAALEPLALDTLNAQGFYLAQS